MARHETAASNRLNAFSVVLMSGPAATKIASAPADIAQAIMRGDAAQTRKRYADAVVVCTRSLSARSDAQPS